MSSQNQTLDALANLIGNKYEVLRWIGGGGMADVFLARHRRTAGLFAVKVLNESLANEPRAVERFMQEARTAATLSGHPNIVSIIDVDEGDGLHYIIMQYVRGEDLRRYLDREGWVSGAIAVYIIAQVADALVLAASEGVVHRDLKPANIRLDTSGRAVVLDFGIAKAADQAPGLTTVGERLGTPYYMSPEQIRGEPCDQRSDLYTLGVVFFELLTGKHPFEGDSYRAIEDGHLFTPAPSPADLNPDADPRCCEIVARLLEKDPALRYQTAADLLVDLRYLSTTLGPVSLHPQPDLEIHEADQKDGGSRQITRPLVETPRNGRDQRNGSDNAVWIIFGGGILLIGAVLIYALFFIHPPPPPPPTPQQFALRLSYSSGDMLLVPEGKFFFGPDRISTNLPAFYVDKTEVTNRAFREYSRARGLAYPKPTVADALPVTGITAEQARSFCAGAGKRLPIAEEWEKAARGDDGREYPWGNEADVTRANVAVDGRPPRLFPVGSFPSGASFYGALDMAGNVFEFVNSTRPPTREEFASFRHQYPRLPLVPGVAWFFVYGGSYRRSIALAKSADPAVVPPAYTDDALGFRCACDVSSVPLHY
jgi:serine/threonine protein kinase